MEGETTLGGGSSLIDDLKPKILSESHQLQEIQKIKIKLEDQLDKMGPRMEHCIHRFVNQNDLVEFDENTNIID